MLLVLVYCGTVALGNAGDANCDGVVNVADVDAFVLGLLDPTDYEATYPSCNFAESCDFDGNGDVDGADIQGFTTCLLSGSCGSGTEVFLRNSIGPDNSTTNGNLAWSSDRVVYSATFYMTPVTVTPQQNVVLSHYRAIMTNQTFEVIDWANHNFFLHIWTNMDAMLSSPFVGDIANAALPQVSPPPTFGVSGWSALGYRDTYDISFDLRPYGIALLAGESRVIAVEAQTSNVMFALLGVLESTEAGLADTQVGRFGNNPVTGWLTTTTPNVQHDGRFAIEIRGIAPE